MIVRRRREPAVNGPPKGATQRRRYLTAYQDRIYWKRSAGTLRSGAGDSVARRS